jgi:AcrR family transcriptional regulator
MARPASSAAQRAPRSGTRPYLRAEDRRRQLLEVATRIAGQEGVEQLTIVGLANAAGVSRQLVYDHFSDLSSLVAAMLMDRFAAVDEAMSRTAHPSEPRDPVQTAREAARRYLELSREDRHILRSLLAHTDASQHELSELVLLLRERSINRWGPILCSSEGVGARARTWAMVSALHGLGDLVSTGVLTIEEALSEFVTLIEATLEAPLLAPPSPPAKRRRRPSVTPS